MLSLLFIHGTGVRRDTFESNLETIRRRLADRPDVNVVGCFWGEAYGASLGGGGISVPDVAVVPAEPVHPSYTRWRYLAADPWVELHALAARPDAPGGGPPDPKLLRDRQALLTKLKAPLAAGAAPESLAGRLERAGIAAEVIGAWSEVGAASIAQQAVLRSLAPLVSCREALAHAILARAFRRKAEADPGFSADVRVDFASRDAIVDHLVDALGGGARAGISDWLLGVLGKFADVVSVWGSPRARGPIMSGILYPIGDILRYQGAGALIRQEIASSLEALPGPVLIFAHSLGGIAAFDTLIERPDLRAKVRRLVTVGTQVGFLYELGLLQIQYKDPLPQDPPFPEWINLYDPTDLLSFRAEDPELFGDGVRDYRLESGRWLRPAHGSYFESGDAWALALDGLS